MQRGVNPSTVSLPLGEANCEMVEQCSHSAFDRVAGGGHPPPAPTERSMQISRTTLVRSRRPSGESRGHEGRRERPGGQFLRRARTPYPNRASYGAHDAVGVEDADLAVRAERRRHRAERVRFQKTPSSEQPWCAPKLTFRKTRTRLAVRTASLVERSDCLRCQAGGAGCPQGPQPLG
jgi:hypothetical protein